MPGYCDTVISTSHVEKQNQSQRLGWCLATVTTTIVADHPGRAPVAKARLVPGYCDGHGGHTPRQLHQVAKARLVPGYCDSRPGVPSRPGRLRRKG